MSRYRTIHCLIWNDDRFPFVSDQCQLVFFHILTTPYSTPFGLYKASIPALAAEKRWEVKAYEKAFHEASENGFVKHDERAQVVYIPKFLKYNHPGNPNVLQAWGGIFEEIPNSYLKNEFYQQLKELIECKGEGFEKAFVKAFGKPSESLCQIQEQEQEQEQEHYPPPDPPLGSGHKKQKISDTRATRVLEHLKHITGRAKFSNTTQIEVMLHQGRTEEECILVLDWLHLVRRLKDPTWCEQYLDNSTPFRPANFDKFLAAADQWQQQGRPAAPFQATSEGPGHTPRLAY